MIGLQFTLMGMTAEMSTRTHYESQNRRPYAVARIRGFAASELPLTWPARSVEARPDSYVPARRQAG